PPARAQQQQSTYIATQRRTLRSITSSRCSTRTASTYRHPLEGPPPPPRDSGHPLRRVGDNRPHLRLPHSSSATASAKKGLLRRESESEGKGPHLGGEGARRRPSRAQPRRVGKPWNAVADRIRSPRSPSGLQATLPLCDVPAGEARQGLHTPPGKSLPVRVVCASRGEGLHPRCRGSGVGNEREGPAALRSRAPHLSCLHHLVHQPKQGGGGHADADASRGKGSEVSRRLTAAA